MNIYYVFILRKKFFAHVSRPSLLVFNRKITHLEKNVIFDLRKTRILINISKELQNAM